MKTEKITGREVELTTEEIYASLQALQRIMNKEFDEKTAYRIGKLHRNLTSIVKNVNELRLEIFRMYGQKDKNGNITVPQPGQIPVREQDETEDAFKQRLAEHEAVIENNKLFQDEIAELLKIKQIVNVPPITLPAGFSITPADSIALAWFLGGEEI